MRKSIFLKYFLTCSLIILTSIVFLGAAVIGISVKYTNDQRQRLYSNNAHYVAQFIGKGYNIMPRDYLNSILSIFSNATDATIMVADENGKVQGITNQKELFSMNPSASDSSSYLVPDSVMKTIENRKDYSEVGSLGGLFKSAYNISGSPILLSDNTVAGAVFVFKRADAVENLVSLVLYIFIICSVIVLALSSVVLTFVTSRMVRPLRQMSAAAKSFARGDFSQRIPVYDNDEVGQLAAAFNNMATSLDSLEEMRRSFVANVSHELKTPMTSIAGFIDGILDGTIPPEKHEYYLHIVSDEIMRLSRLVRSLLDIASIEAGSMKISKSDFDVAETIRRVLIGFETSIGKKELDVRLSGLDDEHMVNADPDIVHRVLYNLIDNAVKFANDKGEIEIKAANSNGKLYIGVRNTGMGIPEKDLPFVFDRFYKTDKSRGLDRKGVGLGLYIIKQTLVLMGEDISVKSAEGSYCEFVFTLRAV